MKKKEPFQRYIPLNWRPKTEYSKNVVKTQKYTWLSFLPLSLLQQFTLFSNQYFLAISITQIFPALKVGLAFTYYLPLVLVVLVSVVKEFLDDYGRWKRDKEINGQQYELLSGAPIQSAEL